MSCPARLYPLRKPKNHKLPVPRWHHTLPNEATHIFTTYVGIQCRSDDGASRRAQGQIKSAIETWLQSADGPSASESFKMIDGEEGPGSTIWVCYWLDESKYNRASTSLSLPNIFSTINSNARASLGIWRETFKTPIPRLETNYSGLDYLPGLARLPGAGTTEHELATYWGAARDRIPDSAHDLFPQDTAARRPDPHPKGLGQHLRGTNAQNIVHIRSGQFWENCGQHEADAYERKLEPSLHEGLKYLWEHPEETGALAVRYLRNHDDNVPAGRPRKETCGAAFFSSLENLEQWAKTHRSHLAIYKGAMSHYKEFGDLRRFRTWHEVSVLKEGNAVFEYVNCLPTTGVIKSVELGVQDS